MIRFGPDICRSLTDTLSREWLETNGLGGFASSTIIGLNTRRYHALLTAATKPPGGRYVLLSKLEETVITGDQRTDLSANQYPGVIHPRGFEYMEEFRLDPFPVFTYRVGDLTIEKSIFMVHGENTTVVQYKSSGSCRLEVFPLIAFREFHGTTHENGAINGNVNFIPGQADITPYPGLPSLYLAHNAASATQAFEWYRNFEYEQERRRGLDFREDLYHPLTLIFDLSSSQSAIVVASTEPHSASEAAELEDSERSRRQTILSFAPFRDPFVEQLTQAADQFIVKRGSGKSVIAGYHWFGDWGRDTMIALPGLTLVTQRFDVAREILLAFAEHVDRGMLPNNFLDGGEPPEYNTADATLWYFEAIRQYEDVCGDHDLIREQLYPVLIDIVDWHVRGTRYGIKMDPADGLLHAGEPGLQLTWMDAKVGDRVITPRTGKPVEIQALWYNALRTMEGWAHTFGQPNYVSYYDHIANLANDSFNRQFWNPAERCLYDVVEDGVGDASIRPNQVIATSLKYRMLSAERSRAVLSKVEQDLLTPYGLRTLSPRDTRYIGQYEGDPAQRDSAYHQGTVWPWLIGAFACGYVNAFGSNEAVLTKISKWLQPLEGQVSQFGLGSIPEIYSGDPPYAPCGCIAQAWSVSEVLRAVVELRRLRNDALTTPNHANVS